MSHPEFEAMKTLTGYQRSRVPALLLASNVDTIFS